MRENWQKTRWIPIANWQRQKVFQQVLDGNLDVRSLNDRERVEIVKAYNRLLSESASHYAFRATQKKNSEQRLRKREIFSAIFNPFVRLLLLARRKKLGLHSSRPLGERFYDFADGWLLLVCENPTDAEGAVGDLIEKCNKAAERHSRAFTVFYFAWELTLLVLAKGRRRFTDALLPARLKNWLKGSAS